MRILYIDDTPYWRETYEKAFREAGVEIKTLPDADGDIINEAVNFKTDLILLDISMPGKNGFEAFEILRGNSNTRSIPIFFFSNINNPEYIKKGLAMGAQKYLIKSDHEPAEVVQIVLGYLENNPSHEQHN